MLVEKDGVLINVEDVLPETGNPEVDRLGDAVASLERDIANANFMIETRGFPYGSKYKTQALDNFDKRLRGE